MKKFITTGIIVGSMIGAYIPALWRSSGFDLSSILGSFIGGAIGIWIGYRIWKSSSGT